MKPASTLVVLLSVAACASTTKIETAPTDFRFGDVSSIVVAPIGGPVQVFQNGFPAMPRFRPGSLGTSRRIDPTVAFVVDSHGEIEPQTVSFLNDIPADFRRAICDWSRVARFEPWEVDGVPQRVLAVSAFTFFRTDAPVPDLPGGKPNSDERWLTQFRETPKSTLFPMLEKRLHC